MLNHAREKCLKQWALYGEQKTESQMSPAAVRELKDRAFMNKDYKHLACKTLFPGVSPLKAQQGWWRWAVVCVRSSQQGSQKEAARSTQKEHAVFPQSTCREPAKRIQAHLLILVPRNTD